MYMPCIYAIWPADVIILTPRTSPPWPIPAAVSNAGSFKAPPPGHPLAEDYDHEKYQPGIKVYDMQDAVARENFRVGVIVPDQVERLDLPRSKRVRYVYVPPPPGGSATDTPTRVSSERDDDDEGGQGRWEVREVWP